MNEWVLPLLLLPIVSSIAIYITYLFFVGESKADSKLPLCNGDVSVAEEIMPEATVNACK
jgi:hypothetical protein